MLSCVSVAGEQLYFRFVTKKRLGLLLRQLSKVNSVEESMKTKIKDTRYNLFDNLR